MTSVLLPRGYRLGLDPDLLRLTRPDGTEAAVFSADGATAAEIQKTAWADDRTGAVEPPKNGRSRDLHA